MPVYETMPSKHQWKVDLGQSFGIFGHTKSKGATMQRIGKLIDEYDELPQTTGNRRGGMNVEVESTKLIILFQIYRHAKFVLKNPHSKEKIGADLNKRQIAAMQALFDFVKAYLLGFVEATNETLDAELAGFFGKDVDPHGQLEDEGSLKVKEYAMQYYTDDLMRAPFKLSFRKGLAYKHRYNLFVKFPALDLYDTKLADDVIEHGASLYVMDQRGRIYVSGRETPDHALKHSSFMGGSTTLCAGTMQIVNGQITWVSGRSGHYRPTVAQMVNLLERLRSYQVRLDNVLVCRENYKGTFPSKPWKNFETCPALELLMKRAWPTGVQPQSMWVG